MEKRMATYSTVLAWRIPWTVEPDGLQSMGMKRVRHDWATNTSLHLTTALLIWESEGIFPSKKKMSYWLLQFLHPHSLPCTQCYWILSPHITLLRASLVAQWWRIHLQCRRCTCDPWIGKIPWRRKRQHTPVFLPGKSHGQKRLVGYIVHEVTKELDKT